jgi:hypothetical protein
MDNETKKRINERRKKILQDRLDYLNSKLTLTRKEVNESIMLKRRIKKL